MASLKNNMIPRSSDDDGVSDDLGRPPLKKFRRVSMEQHSSSEGKTDNNKSSPEGNICLQQKQSTFLKRRRVTLDEQGFINDCSSASDSSSNKKLKLSSTTTTSSSSSSFSSNLTIQNDEENEENNSVSSSISDSSSTENGEVVGAAPCTVLTTGTTTSTEDDEGVDVDELDTTPATGIVTPHPSSLDLIKTGKSTRNEEEMISVNAAQTEVEEKKKKKVESAFVSYVDEVVPMRESPTVKSLEYHEQQRQQCVGSRMNFLGTPKRSIFLQLLVQLLMFVSYLFYKQSTSQLSFPSQDCIYVTGGGFSGFWFSMGRLQSIPEPKAHNYVCYSAGCLGSVATLSNITVDELYDIASTARDEFLRGERHRYDIVEYFVDNMLDKVVASHQESELINSFDKLHILTSVTDPTTKLPMSQMQSPTSMRHLKDLLIETTWIPIAIGSHYSHNGHLDGAFSHFQHPKCNHKIGLAWDIDLYLNALNPNINAEKVTKFWNLGLDYGL